MKATLLSFCVLASSASAAAPVDVVSKVYRETYINVPSRVSTEATVLLQPGGRYTYAFAGEGSALWSAAPYGIFIAAPPVDGTYTYIRTDDVHATITLRGDDGTERVRHLVFTGEIGGVLDNVGSFTFTDPLGAGTPIANVSMRGSVSPGHLLIAGFVVPGAPYRADNRFERSPDQPVREVLIRVVGPGLKKFGVVDPWSDPAFELHGDASPVEVIYSDWSVAARQKQLPGEPDHGTEAGFQRVFSTVGAFPLDYGSKDAVALVRLTPGAYTVVCTTRDNDTGGDALIEVYILP